MTYKDSYIWQLRQQVGQQKLLIPAAAIVVENSDGELLLQQRADTKEWGFPGGSAEQGQDFADVAISELQEEVGLTVDRNDLIPFASLSQPQNNTFYYPNGDVTHYFALCFLVKQWQGELTPEPEECLDACFFHVSKMPKNLSVGTSSLIHHLGEFTKSGLFQLG
ncbi:MAG: NUDIX domain-containing protein [Pseudomonadales bacterium]|nr:NUDIX domain-containing protein [Pseudomonadales bacterium]